MSELRKVAMHVYEIFGPNGVYDELTSASLTPTPPEGYTLGRRLYSFATDQTGSPVQPKFGPEHRIVTSPEHPANPAVSPKATDATG